MVQIPQGTTRERRGLRMHGDEFRKFASADQRDAYDRRSSGPVVLQIAADKSLRINFRSVQKADLHQRLIDIFSTRADRVLFVRADADLEFETVAKALDTNRKDRYSVN